MNIIYFNNGEPDLKLNSNTFSITIAGAFVYVREYTNDNAPYRLRYIIPMTEIKFIKFD